MILKLAYAVKKNIFLHTGSGFAFVDQPGIRLKDRKHLPMMRRLFSFEQVLVQQINVPGQHISRYTCNYGLKTIDLPKEQK